MRKTIALPALLILIVMTSAAPGGERHIKAPLAPVDGSGVTGFAQLTQLPHGGANVQVRVRGLNPGTVYASFYYESSDCSAPADLLGPSPPTPTVRARSMARSMTIPTK